jgi:sugar phosphate isomerase/epimerase
MKNSAMSKIYVQPVLLNNFPEFLAFAKRQHCNLEVATFTYSNVYETDWSKVLQEEEEQLSSFEGKISMHGVFQDLLIHSSDKRIADVSKQRILENLEVAKKLKATQIVFHGSFNPLIRDEHYEKEWIDRNASFWSEVLRKYEIKVLMENTWEQTPDLFRHLLDQLNSSRFKICLDIGHVNVYSKTSIKEWFASLRQEISYIHMSDNMGEKDQHLQIGQGKINWQEFSRLVAEYTTNPEIVLELVTLEKTKRSIKALEENKIYPFDNTP